ncbi:YdaU family protein [Pseudomonas massiliensis]|uniref:YdaU family protein n=1 Tax=Pseudomonas massiliensis TaxID=522492 RepID=UPI000694C5A3|nr:YdaU family protein [Pseudomonas massiliensis]
MNYYSHNIGDYAQATSHLTLVEDAIYSRLLRRYYAEEQAIVNDLPQVCRWVGARSQEEKEAVATVLSEFFTLDSGAWHNKRAEQEIQAYRAKAETNRVNGKKGGRPSGKPLETQSVISGLANETQQEPSRNPNQEPITNNQEPEDQDQKICAATAAPAPSAEQETILDPVQPKASKGSRLAKGWTLPEDWRDWALTNRPDLGPSGIALEADKFRDHWLAATGTKATKADWLATWRNWVRNANGSRNVHAFAPKSRYTNLPQVNADEIRARTEENKRLGVRRANF